MTIKSSLIGLATIVGLFIAAYAVQMGSIAIPMMLFKPLSDVHNIPLLMLEVALCIALCTAAFALLNRYLLKNLLTPFYRAPNTFNLRMLFVWTGFTLLLLTTIVLLFWLLGSVRIETVGQVSLPYGLLWGAVFFLQVGIIEELAFRWFFYGAVKKKMGYLVAVISNGLVFGLVHINQVDSLADAALLMIAAFSVSYLFIVIYELTGSIWAGALVHGVWDIFTQGTGLTLVNVVERKEMIPVHAIDVIVDHPTYVLSGGGFGVESSLISSAVLIIAALLLQSRIKHTA